MKEVELGKLTAEAENILMETRNAFVKLDLNINDLPATMQPDDGAIKLVFVGQYSAGKSSIIKMLTGIDTGIGAAITTQTASVYKWNNIEIVDTPGIQTGLRNDHDEIAYEQINHAALLVFVVTNEGFDRQLGAHFRKLAIEQNRGSNMILIINKMDRAMDGNSPEQQEIIRNDILKVIDPLTPEKLYLSFVSTNSYEEYLVEEDPEFKADLLQESGYETLVDNINAFVKSKNITAKLQAPLYTLETVLRGAMGAPDDDDSFDGMEELTKRKLRIINNAKIDCMDSIQSTVGVLQSDISSKGSEMAMLIREGVTEDDLNLEFKKSADEIDILVKNCEASVDKAIGRMVEDINKNIDRELQSEFARGIIGRFNQINMSIPTHDVSESKAGGWATKIGKSIVGRSIKESSNIANGGAITNALEIGGANLTNFSGTFVHTAVKNVGGFFNIKFAPWEALKFTKGIAMFGQVLAVVGILYQLYELIMSDDKRRENERKIREAKEEIRNTYSEWAQKTYSEFIRIAKENVDNMVNEEILSIEDELEAYNERRRMAVVRRESLADLYKREQNLMKRIEHTEGM